MTQKGDYTLELMCDSGLSQGAIKGHQRPAVFVGWSREVALRKAQDAGWRLVREGKTRRAHELCPACVLEYPGATAPAAMRKEKA